MKHRHRQLLEALESKPNHAPGLQSELGRGIGVYWTLRRLERQGLIESYEGLEVVPARRGRPRVYYRLTEAGLTALHAEREVA